MPNGPFVQVKLQTGDCQSPPIEVDAQVVRLREGSDLRINNQLDGHVDATVQFFYIDSKGGAPIGGFCNDMAGSDLVVPGRGGPVTCEPTLSGLYAYTVEAENHQILDPVLIIESGAQAAQQTYALQDAQIASFMPSEFDALSPDFAVLSVLLVLGMIAGYLFGRIGK